MTPANHSDPRQQDIVDDFEIFDDWMDRYGHIIELGKDLPLLDAALKTDDRLIEGCQSRVWLAADYDPTTRFLHFRADSDAIITKGLVALMIQVLDGRPPEEIVKTDLWFIDRIGLTAHLSPTRANGLLSMVRTMKRIALGHC